MKVKDCIITLRHYYYPRFGIKSTRFHDTTGGGHSADISIDRLVCPNFIDCEYRITIYSSYPENINFLYTKITYSNCDLEIFQTKSFEELCKFLESQGWVKEI